MIFQQQIKIVDYNWQDIYKSMKAFYMKRGPEPTVPKHAKSKLSSRFEQIADWSVHRKYCLDSTVNILFGEKIDFFHTKQMFMEGHG